MYIKNEINNTPDLLIGEFQLCKLKILNYDLENLDLRHGIVHHNLHGNNKKATILRNHMKRIGYNCSPKDVSNKV